MKQMIRIFSMLALVMTLGLVSCSKDSEPEKQFADPEEVAFLEESFDQLTKSLTPADLAELGYFIRMGETPGTLYVDITKEDHSLIKGEVGRVATDNGACITLNLMAMEQIPVTGTVLVMPLIKGLVDAAIYKELDQAKCAAAIAMVNQAVDVKVMMAYDLMLMPYTDPETGVSSLQWFLVQGDTVIPIQQLIEMLTAQQPATE